MLGADLTALGFTVTVAGSPTALGAVLAGLPPGERVALVDPRFTGHRHSLRLALTDPRFAAAAVPGALTVTGAARGALGAALERTSAQVPATTGGAATDAAQDVLVDTLAERLTEAGCPVHRPELGPLTAAVPRTDAERTAAEAAVAATDEEAVRLRSAVKSRDGFFTTHFVSPYSRYLARWCARRGLTPNQVTTASLFTALIAAGCAATGTRGGFVAAGALLLLSFVLDCTDGQLARYALKYSTLGAWLDATFDRAKEYAYYAGLALGAARGGEDVWALALAAMILQTCRHIVDFSFNEANAATTGGGSGSASSPAAALSGRLDTIGWTVWARRMIVLPIGERWALIAVLTALTTPRITLIVLLAAGGFAACYTTAGRLLRSRRRATGGEAAARALAGLTDNGPLAEALARPSLPGSTGALTAPLWAGLGTAALLGILLLPGVAGSWAALGAAALYALCAGRATAAPSPARWTGCCRRCSAPASTAPSSCWPPAATATARCPPPSACWPPSPTTTTTPSTGCAAAPEHPARPGARRRRTRGPHPAGRRGSRRLHRHHHLHPRARGPRRGPRAAGAGGEHPLLDLLRRTRRTR